MIKTILARYLSDLIAWCLIYIGLSYVGGFFSENGSAIYDPAISLTISFIMLYLAIGSMITHSTNALPNDSETIKKGRVDLGWGFTSQYWAAWWPLYLRSR